MNKYPFVPAPGMPPITRRESIKVGDIVGCVKPNADRGYIGVVDHIYRNPSKVTYYIIRYNDGTSESVASNVRLYDIDKTNKQLEKILENNQNAVADFKHET